MRTSVTMKPLASDKVEKNDLGDEEFVVGMVNLHQAAHFPLLIKSLTSPNHPLLIPANEDRVEHGGVSANQCLNKSHFLSLESDHWLNQPNPVYGLCFYTLMALLALFRFAFLARIQVRILINFK